MLSLDVTPGVVTAVFFVVFDLFVLAFVDIVTTNIVCALYYLDIVAGIPVHIKSVDILGLTTYLIGKRFAVANVVGLLIKLTFVAMVFFVNLNIESEALPPDFPETRNGTFDFKTTEALHDLSVQPESRSMEFEVSCRQVGENNATFYRILFNARRKDRDSSQGSSVQPSLEPIDRDTFVCLSPQSVADPVPLLTISGCSTLNNTGCTDERPYSRTVQLNKAERSEARWQAEGTSLFGYLSLKYDAKQVEAAMPEYEKPKLDCIEMCASARQCCPSIEDGGSNDVNECWCKQCKSPYQNCMLLSFNGSHTLLERWRLERLDDTNVKLTRPFPGPFIDQEIFLTKKQIDGNLIYLDSSRSWLDLATRLYRESLVYEVRNVKFRKIRQRTRVPLVSIVLGIFMLVLVATGSVVVAVTIGRDKRPRFNTIDGLSSIAREEKAPSYNSFRSGAPVFLALTPRNGNMLHFGPVGIVEDGVSRDGRPVSSRRNQRMSEDPEML